jgi:hypothetical protein
MKLSVMTMLFFPLLVVTTLLATPACAFKTDSVMDLFKRVQGLNLGRNGYTLGAPLDDQQKKIAQTHPLPPGSANTYKFQDRGVNLVVDKATDRVIVIYEGFDSLGEQQIKALAGALMLDFGEPTVVAHDALLYWAYGRGGRLTPEAFNTAKAQKKDPGILATVKFNSEISIMAQPEGEKSGSAYYIISSNPLLIHFKP